MKRTSLNDVAKAAGVSRMAVSYALRNSSKVSAATRRRIQAIAERLGYRPDPLIQRLSARLAGARSGTAAGSTIGYVTTDRIQGEWRKTSAYRTLFDAAEKHAERQGYRLEEFWLGASGMSGERLSRIMQHRGIQGFIVAPLPEGTKPPHLTWGRFAIAAMGYSMPGPRVHRAVNHQLNTALEAIRQAAGLGYKRIGLCVGQDQRLRVNNAWEHAILFHHSRIPAAQRVDSYLPQVFSTDDMLRWVESEKPDCLLIQNPSVLGYLQGAGYRVPEDIGLVLLDHNAHDNHDLAGMNQQHDMIGIACVDIVVSQIHRNEYGLPATPRTVMIDGLWQPGPSMRAARMSSAK
ncbi:MAG: LacI family DNA-binding transcriptional regulator [Opitutaceae bacterium]|jgi:LacI family transcriptional regulator